MIVIFALAAVLAAPPKPAASPAPRPAAEVLAVVDGVPLTAADLDAAGGPRFVAARTQFYNAQRQALDEAIANRLLEKEARARNTTVDALVREEIDLKVAPVTEDDKKKFYEEVKSRIPPNVTPEQAMGQIETHLKGERARQRRAEYLDALRARAGVKVLLDPPRMAVDANDDPVKGPVSAPVTIVEFSDFQCPYCSRVLPTLKQIEQRYGDRVRVVFRDMPLAIHPDAPKAAEAATCAHEQGKFWEMHDVLFQNQQKLKVEDLKQHAQGLGLDTAKFAECLDSGRHSAEWKKDMEDAEKYGIQSTPSFFINGRMVVGAQPLDAFVKVINEELERAGVPVPPEAPAGK